MGSASPMAVSPAPNIAATQAVSPPASRMRASALRLCSSRRNIGMAPISITDHEPSMIGRRPMRSEAHPAMGATIVPVIPEASGA